MKYFCFQGNDYDCGFASLKMLLAYLNKDRNYLYLHKEDKKGHFSFADLINIANSYQVNLRAYRCENRLITSLKPPCLVLINTNHLVFLKEIKKNKLVIYNPSIGKRIIQNQEFAKIWSGEVLEVESFQISKSKERKSKILPLKTIILSYSLSLLEVASLIIGFSFVKENNYVFIPIILFSIFALLELVEKWYLIKEIKFFDNKFIPLFFASNNSTIKEDYLAFNSFKKSYFTFGRKLLISLLLISFIIVTLIFNNFWNFTAIMFLLLIAVVEIALFQNKESRELTNFAELEKSLIKKDNAKISDSILLISQASRDYTFKISLKKCINTFIVIITSFMMMIFAKEISVNFIIFYTGIYYILFENFIVVLNYGNTKSEYEKEKAKFLDKCNF